MKKVHEDPASKNGERLVMCETWDESPTIPKRCVRVTVSMRYLKANLNYKTVTLETENVHTLDEARQFAYDAREGNPSLSLLVTATVEL